MCEIMTIVAAVVFTAVYFLGRKSTSVFNTMLMFWGAALMWSIDCIRNAIEGESFFTIDREDTILGCIIIASGLLFFAASSVFEYCRRREK